MNTNAEHYPHITVATIVQKDSKFLFVIEDSAGKKVYNQPAGHMEPGETLAEAAIRETLEETAWHVSLSHFLGVSQYLAPSNGVTYVRHTFVAKAIEFDTNATLDADILGTTWMTYEQVLGVQDQLRSPLVLGDLKRFKQGTLLDMKTVQGFIS